MINAVIGHTKLTLVWALRDRVLHAVLGASALLFFLAPVFSSFSMRQVQETALTLTLSASSLVLVVLAVQLGAGAVFRDVERRYTTSALTLPTSRSAFILGRFSGIVLFLALCAILFFVLTLILVPLAASINPSDRPALWGNIALAFGFDACKAVLLAAFALVLSSVSTSFTLPFFVSMAVYLAGSASQHVYDYLKSPMGAEQSVVVKWAGTALYYLLPNFNAFDLHLQAIYALPLNAQNILTSFAYFVVYTFVLLCIGIIVFDRRELP